MAYCFSSGPGSTGELKDYTVALLQPEATARNGSGTEIKKLYERRNEMMHGRWVTPQPEDASLRQMARTLTRISHGRVREARPSRK